MSKVTIEHILKSVQADGRTRDQPMNLHWMYFATGKPALQRVNEKFGPVGDGGPWGLKIDPMTPGWMFWKPRRWSCIIHRRFEPGWPGLEEAVELINSFDAPEHALRAWGMA